MAAKRHKRHKKELKFAYELALEAPCIVFVSFALFAAIPDGTGIPVDGTAGRDTPRRAWHEPLSWAAPMKEFLKRFLTLHPIKLQVRAFALLIAVVALPAIATGEDVHVTLQGVATTQPVQITVSADRSPSWLETLKTALEILGGFTALVAFAIKIWTDRAGWITKLYEKFYEKAELKHIRNLLDIPIGEGDQRNIDSMTGPNPTDFALAGKYGDYLNFFEYVASLWCHWQLTYNEVIGLFGYDLCRIMATPKVYQDIQNARMGYEKLRKLLGEMEARGDCR